MQACKKHPENRASFYDSMCQWHEAEGRSCVLSTAGEADSLRCQGIADKQGGSSERNRQQGVNEGRQAETTGGHTLKKARSERDAAEPEYTGYEGDAAIIKIRKHGAIAGWIVECYPSKGYENERWFLKVQDGSTFVSADGELMLKELRWMDQGSLTKVAKGYGPESLDIAMVKAYGEPDFFTL